MPMPMYDFMMMYATVIMPLERVVFFADSDIADEFAALYPYAEWSVMRFVSGDVTGEPYNEGGDEQ